MENNKLHILVVDDDDKIRTLLKDYLSEHSYMVSTAENAEDAKKKIELIKRLEHINQPAQYQWQHLLYPKQEIQSDQR